MGKICDLNGWWKSESGMEVGNGSNFFPCTLKEGKSYFYGKCREGEKFVFHGAEAAVGDIERRKQA